MVVPMPGVKSAVAVGPLVVERLYWKARALPLGVARLRFLKTARERGYWYPNKCLRDVLGFTTDEHEEP